MRKNSIACGGSPTVLHPLAEFILRRGGGYDPRLRHMQCNIYYLQNIYDNIDINYKGFSAFVKEKPE
jgi:hypothetical protein